MSCEIATQKETGGKFLHLKLCLDKTFGTITTQDVLTITNHNLKINDIVKFDAVAANTTITITDYYYVVAIVDANKVQISNTKGGVAIVFDATGAPTGVVFTSVGGIKSKEFAFAATAIDITNSDSDEWKSVLDEAGQRSVVASGSGVFGDSIAFTELQSKFLINKIVKLMFIDLKASKGFVGFFKLTQLKMSGDYNAEGKYDFSSESSGEVSLIPVI